MLEDIIAKNTFKTYIVVAIYIILFIFIGILFDIVRINAPSFSNAFFALITFRVFPLVTIILTLASIVIIAISLSSFKYITLQGAYYVDPNNFNTKEERQAYRMLEELVASSRLDFMPKLYIMQDYALNAFATGWNKDNSIVCLTTGIMQHLQPIELKAVLAHELSHIIHGDIKLTTCIAALSGGVSFTIMYIVSIFLWGNNKEKGASLASTILMVLQFLIPIISLVLSTQLSRAREYMADTGAAYLMKDKWPMIQALQKIDNFYAQNEYRPLQDNKASAQSYIFNIGEFFSTHPTIENRVASLKDIRDF